MQAVIALITDFGTKDGFVGAMKGVMLSINPQLQIVDITHHVEPFSVFEGALLLKAHYKYFPKGTIFVCVVDPGVGSSRKPLAVRCGSYTFVGPHNGIFDLALREMGGNVLAYQIENYTLRRVNETFHGRDIFAPVAAHLSLGLPIEEVGKRITYTFLLQWEEPVACENQIRGKIVYFDRFGNCITNVPCGAYTEAEFRGKKARVVSHFLEQKENEPAFLCGSFGLMELFLPMDSARDRLKIRLGEEVVLLTKS
ncbi:Adenosyl-chloride synthase [bacterium HR13]|nr:Adenosyl-chloride synthase [bacterium HR13]